MGWLYTNRKQGISVLDFFKKEFEWDEEGRGSQKIIDSHITLTEAYFAVKWDRPGQEPVVFAAICLIRHVPRAKDGFTFGYKDMDETMGPCVCDCPDRLLDLLTPTDSQNALKWREKCRENNRKRKAQPKLVEGLVIRMSRKLTFSDFYGRGFESDTFRLLESKGHPHPRFLALLESGLERECLIPRRTLRQLGYSVAENQA